MSRILFFLLGNGKQTNKTTNLCLVRFIWCGWFVLSSLWSSWNEWQIKRFCYLKEKQENYIFVLFKISCRHLKPSFSTSRAEWGGSVRTARRTWSSSWSVKFTAQTWTCSSTHWREWLTTFAACQKKRASVWSLIHPNAFIMLAQDPLTTACDISQSDGWQEH